MARDKTPTRNSIEMGIIWCVRDCSFLVALPNLISLNDFEVVFKKETAHSLPVEHHLQGVIPLAVDQHAVLKLGLNQVEGLLVKEGTDA
jgi:hypothetical protein